jgi:SAM-dependent methyltransferase
MLSQRAEGTAARVLGIAAELPFPDGVFDVALATLTLLHWPDWRAGIAEMRRVAPHVVVFTFDPTFEDESWLVRDYLPEWAHHRAFRFPRAEEIAATLDDGHIEKVPLPHDCTDGFTGACWARPEAYLDPANRAGMPAVSVMDQTLLESRLARLADDLASGTWDRRYGTLRALRELDLGYRLVTGGCRAREASANGRRAGSS